MDGSNLFYSYMLVFSPRLPEQRTCRHVALACFVLSRISLTVRLTGSFSLTLQLISGSCDSEQGLRGCGVPCVTDRGRGNVQLPCGSRDVC